MYIKWGVKMAENLENSLLFDWFSFTSKKDTVSDIIVMLGLCGVPFQETTGMHGYRSRKYYSGISIHYDRSDGTVWVEMSGQGCRAYETYSTCCDWDKLFRLLTNDIDTYNITRLDVAYDDFTGLLDQDKIIKCLQNGYVVTKFRDYGIEGESLKNDDCTIYLGSKKSDCYVRIYNKAAERGRDDIPHWVRWEFQFRDNHAYGFIDQYLQHDCDLGYTFLGVCNHYIRFLKPSATDSNKRRWASARWWTRFIDDVKKIKVYTPHTVEYNEAKLQNYVFGQAGQAINCAMSLYGSDGFQEYLDNYLELHKDSKNPKYQTLIDNLCGVPF